MRRKRYVQANQFLTVKADMSQNITIQDIGSMHGTYLNGVELPRKTPMAIDDGDVLVFGAEVRRGPEIFPACKFQVNYQFVTYK
jgi:pSer/pThr/pTyr-binding forkhead associated (FHA) protein